MNEIDHTNIPRYAMFRGRKVRIAHYNDGARAPFLIIDADDSKRSVTRADLTFLPDLKTHRKVFQPRNGRDTLKLLPGSPSFQEYVNLSDQSRKPGHSSYLPIDFLRDEYISSYGDN